jgi:hypothetical protein
METVGHDARVGKMLARQDAVAMFEHAVPGSPALMPQLPDTPVLCCAGGLRPV